MFVGWRGVWGRGTIEFMAKSIVRGMDGWIIGAKTSIMPAIHCWLLLRQPNAIQARRQKNNMLRRREPAFVSLLRDSPLFGHGWRVWADTIEIGTKFASSRVRYGDGKFRALFKEKPLFCFFFPSFLFVPFQRIPQGVGCTGRKNLFALLLLGLGQRAN